MPGSPSDPHPRRSSSTGCARAHATRESRCRLTRPPSTARCGAPGCAFWPASARPAAGTEHGPTTSRASSNRSARAARPPTHPAPCRAGATGACSSASTTTRAPAAGAEPTPHAQPPTSPPPRRATPSCCPHTSSRCCSAGPKDRASTTHPTRTARASAPRPARPTPPGSTRATAPCSRWRWTPPPPPPSSQRCAWTSSAITRPIAPRSCAWTAHARHSAAPWSSRPGPPASCSTGAHSAPRCRA
jgi:hypothetical protein